MIPKDYWYQELCNAIIEQGLKDLRYYNRRLKRARGKNKAIFEIEKETVLFELRSEWCRGLTQLDIEFLIERVENEY